MYYEFLILAILSWVSICDWKTFTIPNWSVLAIFILKLVTIYPDFNLSLLILPISVFLVLIFIDQLFFLKKAVTGLGMGDIKLLTVLSIGMNAFDISLLVWLASFTGLIMLKLFRIHHQKVPFAVYISFAYLCLIAGFGSLIMGILI